MASLGPRTAGPDGALRASLVVAQLMGIAVLRHVIGAEPLAGAFDEQLVALVGPAIERYLSPG